MKAVTKEYQTLVLDDLAKRGGISRPIPASQLKQILTKTAPIEKLHPNPGDEFCDPEIGPNYAIINEYIEAFQKQIHLTLPPIADPITVSKLSTGGYLIINGHHRWFAAHRLGIKKIPIEVVNIVTKDDVIARLNRSVRDKCVSFDLDEVLLTDGVGVPGDRNLHCLGRVMYKKALRKGAADLVTKLQSEGFDVWVYTGSYDSANRIQWLFRLHHAKADGIINGINAGSGARKRSRDDFRDQFADKYRMVVHIDNDGVIWTDTKTKSYDTARISAGAGEWANAAYNIIGSLSSGNK